MAANSSSKTNGDSTRASRFDPDFTQSVINATGPKANPRLKQVIGSLIQHLHDFARENEITVDEWMAATELVSTNPPPPPNTQTHTQTNLPPTRSTKPAACQTTNATKANSSKTS